MSINRKERYSIYELESQVNACLECRYGNSKSEILLALAMQYSELPICEKLIIGQMAVDISNCTPNLSPLSALEVIYQVGNKFGKQLQVA